MFAIGVNAVFKWTDSGKRIHIISAAGSLVVCGELLPVLHKLDPLDPDLEELPYLNTVLPISNSKVFATI